MPEKFEGNVPPREHTEQEQTIISNFLNDLQIAETIGFFEMRVKSLQEEYGVELPENIEEMRKNCLERDRKKLENDIATARTDGYKEMRQAELTEIETRLKEFEK